MSPLLCFLSFFLLLDLLIFAVHGEVLEHQCLKVQSRELCVTLNNTGCDSLTLESTYNGKNYTAKVNLTQTEQDEFTIGCQKLSSICEVCFGIIDVETSNGTVTGCSRAKVSCFGNVILEAPLGCYNLSNCSVACWNNCSNHGVCLNNEVCQCQDYYYAADCSVEIKDMCITSPFFYEEHLCLHVDEKDCETLSLTLTLGTDDDEDGEDDIIMRKDFTIQTLEEFNDSDEPLFCQKDIHDDECDLCVYLVNLTVNTTTDKIFGSFLAELDCDNNYVDVGPYKLGSFEETFQNCSDLTCRFDNCSGHGECTAQGACVCDSNFYGSNCSIGGSGGCLLYEGVKYCPTFQMLNCEDLTVGFLGTVQNIDIEEVMKGQSIVCGPLNSQTPSTRWIRDPIRKSYSFNITTADSRFPLLTGLEETKNDREIEQEERDVCQACVYLEDVDFNIESQTFSVCPIIRLDQSCITKRNNKGTQLEDRKTKNSESENEQKSNERFESNDQKRSTVDIDVNCYQGQMKPNCDCLVRGGPLQINTPYTFTSDQPLFFYFPLPYGKPISSLSFQFSSVSGMFNAYIRKDCAPSSLVYDYTRSSISTTSTMSPVSDCYYESRSVSQSVPKFFFLLECQSSTACVTTISQTATYVSNFLGYNQSLSDTLPYSSVLYFVVDKTTYPTFVHPIVNVSVDISDERYLSQIIYAYSSCPSSSSYEGTLYRSTYRDSSSAYYSFSLPANDVSHEYIIFRVSGQPQLHFSMAASSSECLPSEATQVSTDGCNGHGTCYMGTCVCTDGFSSDDCSEDTTNSDSHSKPVIVVMIVIITVITVVGLIIFGFFVARHFKDHEYFSFRSSSQRQDPDHDVELDDGIMYANDPREGLD